MNKLRSPTTSSIPADLGWSLSDLRHQQSIDGGEDRLHWTACHIWASSSTADIIQKHIDRWIYAIDVGYGSNAIRSVIRRIALNQLFHAAKRLLINHDCWIATLMKLTAWIGKKVDVLWRSILSTVHFSVFRLQWTFYSNITVFYHDCHTKPHLEEHWMQPTTAGQLAMHQRTVCVVQSCACWTGLDSQRGNWPRR